jgi:hypothetical protein
MNLRDAVKAARQDKNTPLETRLTKEQLKELHDLARMYADGELRGVSWRLLAEQLCDRWQLRKLQGETLKRNVYRIAHEFEKSSKSRSGKKVS